MGCHMRWCLVGLGGLLLAGLATGCGDKGSNIDPQPTEPDELIVLNQTDSTLYVYNLTTKARVDSINTGLAAPHHLEFSPGHGAFYVVSRQTPGKVAEFTHEPYAAVSSFSMLGAPLPAAIAISPDGEFGYLGDFTAASQRGRIHKYDLHTGMLVDSSFQSGSSTHDIKITTDGALVVAANYGSDDLTLLTTTAGDVEFVNLDANGPPPPGTSVYGPYGLAIVDTMLYVACLKGPNLGAGQERQIRLVSLNTRTVVDSILVPVTIPGNPNLQAGPTLMKLTPDESQLWVTTQYGNSVLVIRTSDNAVWRSIPVGTNRPFGIDISGDGSMAYVACAADAGPTDAERRSKVYMINTSTYAVVDSVVAGRNSFAVHWHGH